VRGGLDGALDGEFDVAVDLGLEILIGEGSRLLRRVRLDMLDVCASVLGSSNVFGKVLSYGSYVGDERSGIEYVRQRRNICFRSP
jgi:hypothetical protein